MIAALALLLATIFPPAPGVSWMSPDAFHVHVGMQKSEVQNTFRERGWLLEPGKAANHLLYKYGDERTVTLAFDGDRLESIRFEYVSFVPNVKQAFAEEKMALAKTLGKPRPKMPQTVLIYETKAPNVYVVLSTEPRSEFGKQGLGFLVVRYFDPPAR